MPEGIAFNPGTRGRRRADFAPEGRDGLVAVPLLFTNLALLAVFGIAALRAAPTGRTSAVSLPR